MLQFQLNNNGRNNRKIRVGTIDEFQGQESEVTIVSMVRSNNNSDMEKAIGFVNIPRSCVAFSSHIPQTDLIELLNREFITDIINNRKVMDALINKVNVPSLAHSGPLSSLVTNLLNIIGYSCILS
jgi:AAA domain-containing protein